MEKVSQNYDPVALTRILQSLERRVEALQQPKLRRIKSVAAEAAQNLAVNEAGYVLDDSQNLDLVVRAEDSRLYRISGQASTAAATSSTPAGVYVLKTGDTMTGLLVLSGDPSAALGAATKQYADTKVADTGDTMTGALFVDGSADAIQGRFQGNGTQTNPVIQIESSAAAAQIKLQGDGGAVFNENGNGSTADFRVETDTDANALFVDASADTVQIGAATASDSAKFYVAGKISLSGELEANGDFNHDGSNVGLFAATPVAQSTGWSISNVTTDKTFDADATTIDEIADNLGTLINYLKTLGPLAA